MLPLGERREGRGVTIESEVAARGVTCDKNSAPMKPILVERR